MAANGLNIVRAELQAYVDRGLFRAFKEKAGKAGRYQWEFIWLMPRPLVLQYEPATATLTLKGLLPHVGRASQMSAEVEDFVASRSAAGLPPHRRLDPARINVGWSKSRGVLSLAIRVKRRDYKYAVNKTFNLLNELFVFLRGSYSPYLEDHFGLSKE